MIMCFICSTIHGLIPFIFRVSQGISLVGTEAIEIYLIISTFFVNLYFFALNVLFLIIGFAELRKSGI